MRLVLRNRAANPRSRASATPGSSASSCQNTSRVMQRKRRGASQRTSADSGSRSTAVGHRPLQQIECPGHIDQHPDPRRGQERHPGDVGHHAQPLRCREALHRGFHGLGALHVEPADQPDAADAIRLVGMADAGNGPHPYDSAEGFRPRAASHDSMPQKPAVERRQYPREVLPLTHGGVSAMLPATDATLVY